MEDKKTKDENGDKGAVGRAATILNAETIAQIVSQTVATTMAALQQQQPRQQQQQLQPEDNAQNTGIDKTPWGLRNTLCPEKLDMKVFTRKKFAAWESSFRSFVREAGLEAKSWEKKLTAFQTVMETETFAKANSD